jgi:hypothetical protein
LTTLAIASISRPTKYKFEVAAEDLHRHLIRVVQGEVVRQNHSEKVVMSQVVEPVRIRGEIALRQHSAASDEEADRDLAD